jgi:hypothetical protein
MSVNPLGTALKAQQGLGSLVQQLVKQADANNDGQISANEFGTFLTKLIDSMAGTNATRKQFSPATTGLGATDGSDPTDPAIPGVLPSRDILPSNWTDNNAPYGVTFAGFSPQDHTDLTLEDLGVPGKAEKYAAYNYLLSNQIQPTNDWAPLAAEALNKKYNTTAYHAIDGETLGFGKEYIHSAPNGYGMARATYNPTATGEFFWGNA